MIRIDRKIADIGIVADDLTSAADGAGPFVARGRQARVGRRKVPEHARTDEVLAVDCGSRALSESEAGHAVSAVTAALAGRALLYKTIDSTLRGHLRAEIEAAFAASGRNRIVLAPAFPEAGRTTQEGIQLVNGTPVAETQYGRDPVHPARTSRLTDLLPPDIGGEVAIMDARTQADLNAQVAGIEDPESVLWIGSPGLARALSLIDAAAGSTQQGSSDLPAVRKLLVLVGSANPVSREQAKGLLRMKSLQLLAAPEERKSRPETVLTGLIGEAKELLAKERFDAVIATGGDTMEALLDCLSISDFELSGELEPGFPCGVADSAEKGRLVLAMKAGGFGDAGSLRRAAERLLSLNEMRNNSFS